MPITTRRGLKAKGDRYELELAAYLNAHLFDDRPHVSRAPLSGGGHTSLHSGGADLLGTPHIFIEAKRTETLRPREALRQAIQNAALRNSADLPTVITRQSHVPTGESLVVMRLDDWVTLYRAFLHLNGFIPPAPASASAPARDDPSASST